MSFEKSNRKDKRFIKVVNGKKVHFGDQNSDIRPGTSKGDSYCARSYGITDKNGNPTRDDILSPNYWSRKVWRCKEKKSI